MLKITYTEAGLHLEQLPCALDEWATRRVLLALRTGDRLFLEQGYASLLVPLDLVRQARLMTVTQDVNLQDMAIAPCDADYAELTLQGTWLTSDPDAANGIFVATLSPRTEFLIFCLWQKTQRQPSSISG